MKFIVGTVGVVVMFLVTGCPLHASKVIPVRETFESTTASADVECSRDRAGDPICLNKAFWLCWRPENGFSVTKLHPRLGERSLQLAINTLPLFAHQQFRPLVTPKAPRACMDTLTLNQAQQYLNDQSERAELWENKDQWATFGDDTYYGFSMLIESPPPPRDYTRMVLAQWKAENDDSPFLSLRLTGGFLHITLAVTAVPKPRLPFAPKDCKVLLAFEEKVPPNGPQKLPLEYPTICESRLNYDDNQGLPAPVDPKTHNTTLTIERSKDQYLPDPFSSDGQGRWIDFIFHIRGGPNGIVEVWANGVWIAKAAGWIGYYDINKPGQDKQYFKVGPYRDPAGYNTVLYLDNLARGTSYQEVDPSRP